MRIKICGLFRDEDIDFVNEARPHYAGFVFAKSKRQVSVPLAQYLRFRLANDIIPVGVFVNTPITEVSALYHNDIISVAQLHGNEDESYITALRKKCAPHNNCAPLKIIKVIKGEELNRSLPAIGADYFLVDSGAGTGKSFNWDILKSKRFKKPWFLAGGVNLKNIEQAMELNPFAIDISSGAETNGVKDRKKILQLTTMVKEGK